MSSGVAASSREMVLEKIFGKSKKQKRREAEEEEAKRENPSLAELAPH